MAPLQAIRKQCLFCMNGQSEEVKLCVSKSCELFYYRFGKNESSPRISALKIIKKYCADCSDGPRKVKNCEFKDCSLFPFRFGKNPKLKGKRGNKDIGKYRSNRQ